MNIRPAPLGTISRRTASAIRRGRREQSNRAHKTVGEFDGKIKYGRLLKPGQRIEDEIFEEKLREDAVRDLGLQVVR